MNWLMWDGVALIAAAFFIRFVLFREWFEGDADVERDVDYSGEWSEVAERARGKLAGALDVASSRVGLDYAHSMLYVPLDGMLIPFSIETVMRDNAPGLRSKAAQWQSERVRESVAARA